MTDKPSMISHALTLAKAGWPVFPCHPVSKRPLVAKASGPGKKDGGLYLATCDEWQVARWWKQHPNALIGVPTGERIGAFVVDLDPRLHSADEMVKGIGVFCDTDMSDEHVSRTQSGGYHLWFALPHASPGVKGIGNRADLFRNITDMPGIDVPTAIASHVDVRGEGGYVIVPPSVMANGNSYDWVHPAGGLTGVELRPCPDRLLDVILRAGEFDGAGKSGARQSPGSTSPRDAATDAQRKYALTALDDELRQVGTCSSGSRNNRLNEAAVKLGALVGAGVLYESVVHAGLLEAASQCGLVKDDGRDACLKTIRSGLEYGKANPRDMSDVGRASPPPYGQQNTGDPGPQRSGESGAAASEPRTPTNGSNCGPAAAGGGDDGNAPVDWEIVAENAKLPQSDIGNGRRLLNWFAADMRNVTNFGWHIYDGRRWIEDISKSIQRRNAHKAAEWIKLEGVPLGPDEAEKVIIETGKQAVDDLAALVDVADPDDDTKRKIKALKVVIADFHAVRSSIKSRRAARLKYSISSSNTNKLNNMLGEAAPYVAADLDQFDADPLMLNVNNGTLRFVKNGKGKDAVWDVKLSDHSRDDLCRKLAPVDYDPDAECLEFLKFLETVHPDEGATIGDETIAGDKIRDFLQVYHGYCMTGLTVEQVMAFYWGGGRNGKSTFVDVIARIMGDYANVTPFETLAGDDRRKGGDATPDLARLPGARLVRASEPEQKMVFRESLVKSLTSGEPILVRKLHADFVEVYPTFKLVISGNHKPGIMGTDDGIWRRLLLVPWPVQIAPENVDKALPKKLWAERSGILNWLIAGVLSYLQEGLLVPDSVKAATQEYRQEQDPVGQFLREGCDITGKDGDITTPGELYPAYQRFCKKNGVYEMKDTVFNRQVAAKASKMGYRKGKKSGTVYYGIKIKADYLSGPGD